MILSSLDRKLLRDLWGIRGQALAISLVIGAGVAMFVLMLSTFGSLDLTQRTYYDRYRFADVFASLKRAPLSLQRRIADIPGVVRAETRIVADVNLDVPGLARPAVGRLISIPELDRGVLCDVYLRGGRYIEPGRADEVLVNENFARANNLQPGDGVIAVINGRRRELRIVGVALSPEYIYTIRPGEMISDDELFGVFWMERRALAAAFNMEGGFNDVVLKLSHGASVSDVIVRLDRLLAPYGGVGAIPRSLQPSHFYLTGELDGLRGSGAVVPVVFLAVAAFLLNVVLSRIVAVQREQIAVLKALGYSNAAVALHYLKWSLLVAAVGTLAGIGVGAWMGAGMTRMYASFFHFPILEYRLPIDLVAKAVLVSLISATAGALLAVRQVIKLPPAEAMRPEPPARYRESAFERAGAKRWLSQPARIVLRNLQRSPARASLAVVGIAFGGALIVVGTFTLDSMDHMIDVQFNVAQRYDALVSFFEPASSRSLHEVRRFPAVVQAEPFRAVPARLRFGHRSRNTAITGLPEPARLNRVIDGAQRPVKLPPDGLVLSSKLAELLAVTPGDRITVEVLEGARPVRRATVAGVVEEYMGVNAYMELDALHRMMQEGDVISGAYLLYDGDSASQLYDRVKNVPAIAAFTIKDAAIESFNETLAESIAMFRTVTVLFATIIAFGVVYNSARVSLSERGRELATLRVIGFRRGEIASILLGELALLTLLAAPLGVVLGYALAAGVVQMYDTEVYRLPLIVTARTCAMSMITVVGATVLSAMAVRRKLHQLDLIAVLKTRE